MTPDRPGPQITQMTQTPSGRFNRAPGIAFIVLALLATPALTVGSRRFEGGNALPVNQVFDGPSKRLAPPSLDYARDALSVSRRAEAGQNNAAPGEAQPNSAVSHGGQGGASPGIVGRWKLIAAEDVRADGSVARYPWGRHPVGSIVVQGGSCYVQIMSSDVPTFAAGGTPANEQMKAALLSTYIAYSGPCTVNESEGSVTLKVDAAWRPDYVGTEQKRFFRIDNGKLIFGPAPNSLRGSGETLTRRLTLERQ